MGNDDSYLKMTTMMMMMMMIMMMMINSPTVTKRKQQSDLKYYRVSCDVLGYLLFISRRSFIRLYNNVIEL